MLGIAAADDPAEAALDVFVDGAEADEDGAAEVEEVASGAAAAPQAESAVPAMRHQLHRRNEGRRLMNELSMMTSPFKDKEAGVSVGLEMGEARAPTESVGEEHRPGRALPDRDGEIR